MTRSSTLRRPRRRVACRPLLESLEGRQVLSAVFDSVVGLGSPPTGSGVVFGNAVDADGNTYVTGQFSKTVDFDPSVVHSDGSDILTALGSMDVFVAKYAPGNTLVWARRMGSGYVSVYSSKSTYFIECGSDIAVDNSGNVYVTGQFESKADFGPFTLTSAQGADAFVTKLDANGNVLWAKSWGSSTVDSGQGVAVDPLGNVVVVGDTCVAISGSSSTMSTGFEVHKFGPDGTPVWTNRIDNSGGSAGSVATDGSGSVYLGGMFTGKVDFDPDPRKTNYVTGATQLGSNGYVLKLTSAGTFAWVSPLVAKTAELPGSFVALNDLALDTSGNVIIGGRYVGQVDFNPSSKIDYRLPNIGSNGDGFLAKLSPAGALTWATPLGGAAVTSVAADAAGSVYAAGSFNTTSPFVPGFGLPTVMSNGLDDEFVVGLTASGSVEWAYTFGGTGNDYVTTIAVDAAGTIYLGGMTNSPSIDFDPAHPGTEVLTGVSMYLLKLKKR